MFSLLLSLLEFEVSGEDVIHEVVKVGSINQPLSLVAWVHGSPAELVVSHLTLHEAPHRATHHSGTGSLPGRIKILCTVSITTPFRKNWPACKHYGRKSSNRKSKFLLTNGKVLV